MSVCRSILLASSFQEPGKLLLLNEDLDSLWPAEPSRFKSYLSVPSKHSCALLCHRDADCVIIFYDDVTKECLTSSVVTDVEYFAGVSVSSVVAFFDVGYGE